MTTSTRELIEEVIERTRSDAFVPEYQPKAPPEECLGIAIAHFFEWDSRIFDVCAKALDDANFHEAAAEVRRLTEPWMR